MSTLLQDRDHVETFEVEEYIPTTEDLADYHAWSAGLDRQWWEDKIEREDRMETMERIRRDDFARARSAACEVRGIADFLQAQGLDATALRLRFAADDVIGLVGRYA